MKQTSPKAPWTLGRVLQTLLALVFAVGIGGLFLVFGIKELQTPYEDFVPTTGVITQLSIKSTTDPIRSEMLNTTVFVSYQYEVKGRVYRGMNSVGSQKHLRASNARSEVADLLARYPKGAKIKVFYDPQKPSSYSLRKDRGYRGYVLLGLGVIALLGGGLAATNVILYGKMDGNRA